MPKICTGKIAGAPCERPFDDHGVVSQSLCPDCDEERDRRTEYELDAHYDRIAERSGWRRGSGADSYDETEDE